MVVIDEDRLAGLIDAEAVQVEAGDLAQPPAGLLQQPIGQHRHLAGLVAQHPHWARTRPAGDALATPQQIEVGIELGDDMGGDGPGLFLLDDAPTGVAPAEEERGAQTGEEAHLGGLANYEAAALGDGEGGVGRQRLAGDGRSQRPQAQQEPVDVSAAEGTGVVAGARPRRQHVGQHGDGAHPGLHGE